LLSFQLLFGMHICLHKIRVETLAIATSKAYVIFFRRFPW
jgi:hypothetical protein